LQNSIKLLFHTRIFQKFGTSVSKLPTDVDQHFNYGDKVNLKKSS